MDLVVGTACYPLPPGTSEPDRSMMSPRDSAAATVAWIEEVRGERFHCTRCTLRGWLEPDCIRCAAVRETWILHYMMPMWGEQ